MKKPSKPYGRVRVYGFSGLGEAASRGIKKIVDDSNLILGVSASYHPYTEWELVASLIRTLDKSTKIVLVGHSYGASAALYAATAVERDFCKIDALITFDPSKWWSATFGANPIPVVPSNVIRAINFRIALGPVGMGELRPDSDDLDEPAERIENTTFFTLHTKIDDLEKLQERSVSEVRRLL